MARSTSAAPSDPFGLPAQDSPEAAWWRESMSGRDQRLQWWREARFGMFIHWGVYSALGNEYQGRKGGGYAEHIQRVLKIPISQYRTEVAGKFNPSAFDADQWISLARKAGVGYFVITAKHHDGFAMYDSSVSDYNIVKATPFKQDPMKELKAACARHGLKFGFYYSHAFDWGEADAPGNDWDYSNPGGDKLIGGREWWTTTPAFLGKARKYVDQKAIPQLLELIQKYDPDILWFDTPHKLPPSENLRILKAVRAASPRVVINGRLVRSWGDYSSTADRPAEFRPHAGDWEGIPTTNESYGWNKHDVSHKPSSHFIELLAKAAARGGNLLMNIGPMGNGQFDPKDVEILNGIGQWWTINGESIRGTARTSLPVQTWGESTVRSNLVYLHVFAWPREPSLVVGGLQSAVRRAYLLSDGKRAELKVERLDPLDVKIQVPGTAPDPFDSVLVLECDGPIRADRARLIQPAFSLETLRVFDAELEGKTLRFGAGKTRDAYVENWSKENERVTWPVRLKQRANLKVILTYDAVAESTGGFYAVKLGATTLSGTVESGQNVSVSLGKVCLEPGVFDIQVAPTKIAGAELMRLRSLALKAVD